METLNRLPWAAQSAVFQRLASISDVGALTREKRHKYDHALKKYRDTLNVLDGAVQDGIAEGRAEERIRNAKSLLANGVSMEIVAQSLGLTEEEQKAPG